MSYADEMKNLVGDIKSSHRDRTTYLKELFGETQALLEADRKELKEMAKDLREFLAKSENVRMADFRAMMGGVAERIEEIQADTTKLLAQFDKELAEMAKDLKAFLAKSETNRMADFKVMAKDIKDRIGDIFRTTKGLLVEYKEERKRAAGYWAVLAGKAEKVEKEATIGAEKPKKKREKKGRPKKK